MYVMCDHTIGYIGLRYHNGGRAGPVDREGTREKLPKHNISSIQGLRVSPGMAVEAFPFT